MLRVPVLPVEAAPGAGVGMMPRAAAMASALRWSPGADFVAAVSAAVDSVEAVGGVVYDGSYVGAGDGVEAASGVEHAVGVGPHPVAAQFALAAELLLAVLFALVAVGPNPPPPGRLGRRAGDLALASRVPSVSTASVEVASAALTRESACSAVMAPSASAPATAGISARASARRARWRASRWEQPAAVRISSDPGGTAVAGSVGRDQQPGLVGVEGRAGPLDPTGGLVPGWPGPRPPRQRRSALW